MLERGKMDRDVIEIVGILVYITEVENNRDSV